MNTRLESFMAARAAETYPEPATAQHSEITNMMAPLVAAMLPAGASVLDVGCGQGPALEWFSKSGFDVTGTTINRKDLEACVLLGHKIPFIDMHSIGEYFYADEFDCIWARHVLEHSVIPFFVLHEFARVLKPGGILYVEVPMPDTPCNHVANLNHYSVLGKDAWLCLIARSGFELHEVREIGLQTMAGPDKYLSVIARKL
jgi:2-polyprenyl-3-methyl-5-hydroxy-6-metoxy-1,4-benzoquinol methylase